MKRYLFVFLVGLLMGLKSHFFKTSYEAGTCEPEISSGKIPPFFIGHRWLEQRMSFQSKDLDQIYKNKILSRNLGQNTQVKKYWKSSSLLIEERTCNESPYIEKPLETHITSQFGYRVHPMSGKKHVHAGLDFRGEDGTPVLASAPGVVRMVGPKGAYGKTIILDHGNGFKTLYGHLSGYSVKKGQWVSLKQTIGYIGRTGRATGPHLHFELRCHNVPLNPSKYIGSMGQIAEVKFRKRRRPSYAFRSSHSARRKPNSSRPYTPMAHPSQAQRPQDKQPQSESSKEERGF